MGDVILEVRDTQGNRAAIGEAARSLEEAQVAPLVTISSTVTIAAKAATKQVPIVFAIGTDAATQGLVETLARRAGRLIGVQRLSADFTGKRLQILKERVPDLRRVVTFYDSGDAVALQSAKLAREASRTRSKSRSGSGLLLLLPNSAKLSAHWIAGMSMLSSMSPTHW